MPRFSIIRAVAAAVTLPAFLLAETPVLPQVDQFRQFTAPPGTIDLQGQRNAPSQGLPGDGEAVLDDAFGTQAIFKRQEKARPFTAFAEIGAFMTNNVALTKREAQEDGFLVGTVGASFSRRFAFNLRLDASAVGSAFRYDRFPQLDFQSVDLSAAVAWSPPQLRGAELLVRYTFTELTSAEPVDDFYKNHAILLGVQRIVPFSRAQAVYFGASAQWSFADPKPAGRDEYTAYAGYLAQLTRHINANLSYRYGRYVYRHGSGRHDDNQTISLALRYTPREWLSLSAAGYFAANRSNQPAFDYDVANAGFGLQISIRF